MAKAPTNAELLVAIAEAAGRQTQASSFGWTDQSAESVAPGKCKRLFTSKIEGSTPHGSDRAAPPGSARVLAVPPGRLSLGRMAHSATRSSRAVWVLPVRRGQALLCPAQVSQSSHGTEGSNRQSASDVQHCGTMPDRRKLMARAFDAAGKPTG